MVNYNCYIYNSNKLQKYCGRMIVMFREKEMNKHEKFTLAKKDNYVPIFFLILLTIILFFHPF